MIAAVDGELSAVQALIELLVGLIALLAAAVLSPLGINLHSGDQNREVHRIHDCGDPGAPAGFAAKADTDC
jgi:hypothetical protein